MPENSASGSAGNRNNAVVPLLVVIVALIAVIIFLVTSTSGQDTAPPAAATAVPATPTATGPNQETDSVVGSGDAPEALAITRASFARSQTGLGVAAEVPDIDPEAVSSITLELRQGSAIYNLSTTKDPRGSFISPRLRVLGVEQPGDYACAAASIKLRESRLNMVMPLTCLLQPDSAFTGRLIIKGDNGQQDVTSFTSALKPVA